MEKIDKNEAGQSRPDWIREVFCMVIKERNGKIVVTSVIFDIRMIDTLPSFYRP